MEKQVAFDNIMDAMLNVREYFRHGIAEQLESQVSFGGNDAQVIIEANRIIDQTEPFVSENLYKSAKSVIYLSKDEFNKLLNVLRKGLDKKDGIELAKEVNILLSESRNKIENKIENVKNIIIKEKNNYTFTTRFHEEYKDNVLDRLNVIEKQINVVTTLLGKKNQITNITNINAHSISGDSIQIGSGNIQHIKNIENGLKWLINEINLLENVEEEDKEKAKNKIQGLLYNPTISAILGGAASGLLGLFG